MAEIEGAHAVESESRDIVSHPKGNVEPLLTEAEAAEILAIRQDLLREWRYLDRRDDGHRGPPHRKIGRAVRYRPSDLTTWIDSR